MAYRADIEIAAAAHALDPDLVAAVVEQESDGLANAYRYEPAFWNSYLRSNPKYATRDPREVSASYGLMQIMYPTAVDYGFAGAPEDLWDPATGLEYGCRVLAALLAWATRLYRGLETDRDAAVTRAALAAYNGGKGGNAPTGPLRNRAYAERVLARYRRIRASH